MFKKRETGLARAVASREPFAILRQMSADLDRVFDEAAWPTLRWPAVAAAELADRPAWTPGIDMFEKDNRLVTKIDLPGMKKEDITVEVTEGQLTISGERKREYEEEKKNFYRCECEYGSFYRSIPLPEGTRVEDVKATFADGVLEVSAPLPARAVAKARPVEIQEPGKPAKTAAQEVVAV